MLPCLIHSLSILMKTLFGLYGYSGEHTPPKFGDFEAQRHWMELTTNIPVSDWYKNSTENSDKYWPMDYPPMSGYHSYLCGLFFKLFLPESVQLISSHGYENPLHKILMRFISLMSDICIFHVSAHLLLKQIYKKNNNKFIFSLFMVLMSPCLSIIDHGHFQFNNVMHGFFLLSVYFLLQNHVIFAIISYSMCILFKQMGLYYAIPFPLIAFKMLRIKNTNIQIIIKLGIFAVTTVLSFLIFLFPWIYPKLKISEILIRVFPTWRGIFEDKVATFWCTLNIFYKIKQIKQTIIMKLSLLCTLTGCFIPIICLLYMKKIRKKIIFLSFFIMSLSFYLFSFHVHEKTIIVPYLAYLLCYYQLNQFLMSFTLMAMFSMKPMLERENQVFTYGISTIMFCLLCLLIKGGETNSIKETQSKKTKMFQIMETLFKLIDVACVCGVVLYHIGEKYIKPPTRYPYFYPMINGAFSFCYFIFLFGYSSLRIIYISFKFDKNN